MVRSRSLMLCTLKRHFIVISPACRLQPKCISFFVSKHGQRGNQGHEVDTLVMLTCLQENVLQLGKSSGTIVATSNNTGVPSEEQL